MIVKNTLFSIIVPIFKTESYLSDCIDSILSQTFNDFELILVDDGSSDECSSICDTYAKEDNRIKVIHKKNGGLVSARQEGVKIATGRYCVAVDSDDWLETDYLLDFEKVFKLYNPDMICGGMNRAYTDKTVENKPRAEYGYYSIVKIKETILPILLSSTKGIHFEPNICGKAIKTEIYKQAQLLVDPRIKFGEDATCTAICFYKASSAYIMDSCKYNYRFNETSMTREKKTFPWNQTELRVRCLEKTINPREYNFEEQYSRSIVHAFFNCCMSQFYRDERYAAIRKDICSHINTPFVQEAIKNAEFSSAKGKMARIALKYKLTFLMMLYSKIW